MAVIKCKMCGGDLEIVSGTTVAECDYCGTKQTLPKANEAVVQNLFNRANTLRLKCEFDKAEQIYEKILQEDNTEAEAHWGIVLCKYGIEYVEDPKSYQRIPTCHRTSYDAVTADADYLAAIEHADVVQRGIYEAEAAAIDRIQKNILSVVKDEKPFDVFICYKETDENGKRTIDSAIANDIYYQLTQEGLKVFYAAITLEDKLGQEYEPYIFAALNSARVMLVVGTQPQYFTAVWVKNEWSRFLKLMKTDRSKLLIPCYKDMDAYELPEEFAHLQAQDMGKIGFINDVVRGIKKVTVKEEPKATVVKETVVTGGNANTEPLIRRVFIFLEDGNWTSANEYCEKVLDMEPENAQAYLGKMMAELQVRRREKLTDCARPLETARNYQKVLRYADPELSRLLTDCNEQIKTRIENKRLEDAYTRARELMEKAELEQSYRNAAEAFGAIPGYRDADQLQKECLKLAENARKNAILKTGTEKMSGRNISELQAAVKLFQSIPGHMDADERAEQCQNKIKEIWEQMDTDHKNGIYAEASMLLNSGVVDNISRAITLFNSISGWKDADAMKEKCAEEIRRINAKLEADRIQEEKEKQRKKRIRIIALSAVAAVAVMLVLLFTLIIPSIAYSQAEKMLSSGQYEKAMVKFWNLNFRDSRDKYATAFNKLKDTYREKAGKYEKDGDKVNAAIWYRKAGDTEKADELFNIPSRVYAGEYTSAGIMKDGSLKYLTNFEHDRGTAREDLVGITAFLNNTGAVLGVDGKGRILRHNGGGYTTITFDEKMHIETYEQVVEMLSGVWDNGRYVVMLREDGTITEALTEGDPYPEIRNWKNIKHIQSGWDCIYGIDKDGNVYQVMEVGTREAAKNVASLKKVKKLIPYVNDLVAVGEDGTVTVLGDSNTYYKKALNGLTDVQDMVSCGDGDVLVLYRDGTVKLFADDLNAEKKKDFYDVILKELETWNGVTTIQSGAFGVFGIRYDGTVKYQSLHIDYSTYSSGYTYSDHGEFAAEVESWSDILFVVPAEDDGFTTSWTYAMGVKFDGTVVSTGDGEYYTSEPNGSGSYYDVSHSNGTYHKVYDWVLW